MQTEFRRADSAVEIRRLRDFDRKVFPPADVFDTAYWRAVDPWWMVVNGRRAGCCAFEHNVEFADDVTENWTNRKSPGTLYICTTGILPAYRGRGLGRLFKAWQIAFARFHGYRRVVTNTRESNAAMVHLNQAFGFQVIRRTEGYYADPDEATLVLDLTL